jgi:hypothetical protein
MKHSYRFVRTLVAIVISTAMTYAQAPFVAKVSTSAKVDEGSPLAISVELMERVRFDRATLCYRKMEESSFKEVEMLLSGRAVTGTIPKEDVKPPYIDYYIKFEIEGRIVTHPLSLATDPDAKTERDARIAEVQAKPLRIQVAERNPKDMEVRIMSPEPGETIGSDEFALVISLYYASDNVDRKATKILIDGKDVTKEALPAEDMITWAPSGFGALRFGAHTISIQLYTATGELYHTVESSFNLASTFTLEEEKEKFLYGVNGQIQYISEKIDSTTTTYLRGDLRSNATYGPGVFGLNLHLDNQEKSDRQPQNRYSFTAGLSWLRVQVGDAFPVFPSLIVSGKRVRGISANLATGYFNIDVTYGESERLIEGIKEDTLHTDIHPASSRPLNSILSADSSFYTKFETGVFTRDFFAIRPSFGSGENFQLGLTYLKAKDKVGSIVYGIQPKENLVAGVDLTIAAFEDRFRWESQGAVGIKNKDISKGNFTSAQFDTMAANATTPGDKKSVEDLRSLANLANKFLTINDQIEPTNPVGEGLPSLAVESAVSLNVLNNFIRGMFFRRGNAYVSFGNEFIQTDIQGYQVSDRLRLFSNKLFLSLAYEAKADNIANTKDATTKYTNLNTAVNINPGAGIPTLAVGYGIIGRQNDKYITKREIIGDKVFGGYALGVDTTQSLIADDKSNRIFVASNYDFTLGARHTFSFSLSKVDKKDNSLYKRNQASQNIQAMLISNLANLPVQTTFGYLMSKSRNESMNYGFQGNDSLNATTEFNYTSINIGATVRLMDDNLRLIGMLAPIFGDFKRTAFTFGADYTVARGHNVEFRLDYITNKVTSGNTTREYSDVITSLVYRFDI